MAGKSDYLEAALLDHVFGKATLTVASTDVGLTTVAITDVMTGGTVTEPTDANYARVNVAPAGWTATAGTPSPSGLENVSDINFPSADAAYPSPLTDFFIADNIGIGLGQVLYFGTLQGGPIAVANGETPRFQAGTCICTED